MKKKLSINYPYLYERIFLYFSGEYKGLSIFRLISAELPEPVEHMSTL